MIIAVDFDGTCTTHEYPRVGHDIGAAPVLQKLVAAGHHIILWTMRSGRELEEAVQWFQERDIPLFGVNRHPTQKSWTKSPKAYAQLYIDDAALGCPLCQPQYPEERQHVDWKAVELMLENMLLPLEAETHQANGYANTSCSPRPLPETDQPTAQPRQFMTKILACLGIHI